MEMGSYTSAETGIVAGTGRQLGAEVAPAVRKAVAMR